MNTTTCLNCRGVGRISAKGYDCDAEKWSEDHKTVCPACMGVGKIKLTSQPDCSDTRSVLAKLRGEPAEHILDVPNRQHPT